MKTIHSFLVGGLILAILSVAGCQQESAEPSNHFFRVYETTPVPALGLDALPTQDGYVVLTQTFNPQYQYKWEGGSPLFIQTNAIGNIDYTHFWENYNRTEKFAQPYPYILSNIGDTIIKTIGYHRISSIKNNRGCFISYNTVKGLVDTCWENCPKWSLDAPAESLLGATMLQDGTTIVAQKSDNVNIKFLKFDKNGEKENEFIYEDIYYNYFQDITLGHSGNNMYYTSKNNFFSIKENKSYIYIIASDEDEGDSRLFWFPSSFDGSVKRFDGFLPEDNWASTDSFNILIEFSLNTISNELSTSFRYKGKKNNYDVNIFEDVKRYKIHDYNDNIYISISHFNGDCELFRVNKRDLEFQNDLAEYSNFARGLILKEDTHLQLMATKIFYQNYGAVMEINSVRELEGKSPGAKDLLICGTIYQQSDNPRPFLMRVDENGDY